MTEREFGKEYGTEILENGLPMHFYDQSRTIAGDRYFVQLVMRIPIPRPDACFEDSDPRPPDWSRFLEETGADLAFVQTKTRNFISKDEAPVLLAIMKEQLLEAARRYLANPSFAKRFILKRYEEWNKTSAWQEAHHSRVREIEQKERESE